ncbi:MAG: hypothetical protein A3G49_06470 [Candidatus Sungbacteria bacterium RIFCSPLOWO2_12_FULL_41_11]|uniref:Uncharacterized protein n=1 Tax=Candidatus Sungbacteria bacterium RIFCSPLOWO2_12_FULL_41_11 TaxID=1802286 RepID=A0A1G2LSI1_9BACT|nr:MAG: hypothetical protein UV01_C0003G0072 [Parcubacteria group bacterium GW2011_GWA2_42_14]OGZ99494.1 MAG: hypothetical protein A3D41_05920 [Candidatus Sungbacteria bacterium RIFCSPHIGHO2_02_FULL_41_12b]OHA14464.1 MAG: hypothetical protein A3G49_06470 [Candidatus Sungbacteria bacterium RIFCSPLOWO2_12_FULL_41_11]
MVRFKFNPEKGGVEKIIDPDEKKLERMREEVLLLESEKKKRILSPEEETRLWNFKKRIGVIDIPDSEIHTGQYL